MFEETMCSSTPRIYIHDKFKFANKGNVICHASLSLYLNSAARLHLEFIPMRSVLQEDGPRVSAACGGISAVLPTAAGGLYFLARRRWWS